MHHNSLIKTITNICHHGHICATPEPLTGPSERKPKINNTMAKLINASIDLTKIDKSRIVTTNKDGQPFKNGGKFYNIQISIEDEVNEYDQDCSIRTSLTKEERESGQKPTYIGNGKTVWTNEGGANKPAAAPATSQNEAQPDGLPF